MATSPLISQLDALIVDDLATRQAVLGDLLSMIGARRAEVVSSAEAALKALRARRFGLLVFDTHMQSRASAMPLFEYVREQRLLPSDTLVYVVSDDRSEQAVALSGEWQPDAFFVKPLKAGLLEERLLVHLERQRVLRPVLQALDEGLIERALAWCEALLRAAPAWTLPVLQLQVRALLLGRRHAEAAQTCAQALAQRPELLWARIGMARARLRAGDLAGAREAAVAALASEEGARSSEALEVLAECMEALGEGARALEALQRAADVVPSPRRLRHLAECASRQGDALTAKAAYQRLIKSTQGSLVARELDGLRLMQVRVDLGEAAEAMPDIEAASRRAGHGQSRRGIALAIKAQALVQVGDERGAQAALARARHSEDAPGLDVATLALAKAELLAGDQDRGVQLLLEAARQDPAGTQAQQVVVQALRDTNRDPALVAQVGSAMLQQRLQRASEAIREQRFDEGVALLVGLTQSHPGDAGLLLQASRLVSVVIKLTGQDDELRLDCVRNCLDRLDELMPGHESVVLARRYFDDTQQALAARRDTRPGDRVS